MKTTGCVLDWHGGTRDWSRYHHTITNNNAIPVRGVKGDAMSFNGTTSFVDCGNEASLNFGDGSSDSPFTMDAFVNMNDATDFSVVTKTGVGWDSNAEWELYVHTTNTLRILVYDESASAYLIRYYNADLSSYENQWIHVAATYNGGGSVTDLQLYLNGVRVDDSSATDGTYVAMEALSETAKIGRLGTHYANGTINNVKLYNRALTPLEIWNNYVIMKPYIPLSESPVAIV